MRLFGLPEKSLKISLRKEDALLGQYEQSLTAVN